MIFFTLKELWKKYADRQAAQMRTADQLDVRTFAVTDPQLARRIRQWMAKDQESREAVEQHLDTIVPHYYRAAQMLYQCDMDGHLERISFCGIVPHGWGAASVESSWLKPVTSEAKAAVQNLPPSSREELHQLTDWPTIEPRWLPKEQHMYARQVNRLLQPVEKDGQIYICAPHPDNFKTSSPVICKTLYGWELPDSLKKSDLQLRP